MRCRPFLSLSLLLRPPLALLGIPPAASSVKVRPEELLGSEGITRFRRVGDLRRSQAIRTPRAVTDVPRDDFHTIGKKHSLDRAYGSARNTERMLMVAV